MNSVSKTLVFCASFALLFCSASLVAKTFGVGADMSKYVPVEQVLSKVGDFDGKTITLTGTVNKVCLKKGCWLRLKVTDNDEITVKVDDGVMVFTPAAIGKTAHATGVLKQRTLSIEQSIAYLQHKADENGEHFEPSAVTEALVVNIFSPVGVTIEEI